MIAINILPTKISVYSKNIVCLFTLFFFCISGFAQSQSGTGFRTVTNTNGPTIGYSESSGITILTIDVRTAKYKSK